MIYLENTTSAQTINIPYPNPDKVVTKKVQSVKSFTANDNGEFAIYPDSGFTSMEKVNLTVDKPISGGTIIFTGRSIFDYTNDYSFNPPVSALTVDAQNFGDRQYWAGYRYAQDNIGVEAVELSVSANGEYDAVIGPSGEGYIKKVIVDVPSSGGSNVDVISTAITVTGDVETIQSETGKAFSAVTVDATQYGQNKYTDGINYQKSLLSSSAFTENGTYTYPNGLSAITVNVSGGTQEPYFGKVAYFDERRVYDEWVNNAFRSNISNFNSVGDYIKIGFSINCEDAFWLTETDGSILRWIVNGSYNQVSGGTIYIGKPGSGDVNLPYDINDELLFTLTITGVTGNTRDANATIINKTKGISTSLSGRTLSNNNNLTLSIGSDEEDFDTYISYWSLYSYEVKTSQNHYLILPRSDMKFWDVINNTEVDVTTDLNILTEYVIDFDGHHGPVSTPYFIPKYPWKIQ